MFSQKLWLAELRNGDTLHRIRRALAGRLIGTTTTTTKDEKPTGKHNERKGEEGRTHKGGQDSERNVRSTWVGYWETRTLEPNVHHSKGNFAHN